eukprot:7423768-Ditylum_brightwellii.AAC.1
MQPRRKNWTIHRDCNLQNVTDDDKAANKDDKADDKDSYKYNEADDENKGNADYVINNKNDEADDKDNEADDKDEDKNKDNADIGDRVASVME